MQGLLLREREHKVREGDGGDQPLRTGAAEEKRERERERETVRDREREMGGGQAL